MHRVRILSYILLVILAVFIFYVFKKYQFNEEKTSESPQEITLEKDSQISIGTEIITSTFKLKADKSIYSQKGSITYQNFELQTLRGKRLITITGDKAAVLYKKEQIKRAVLTGNINAYTSDGMTLKSNKLNYFHRRQYISSPKKVYFSKGKIEGEASRFIYFLKPGIIQLIGGIEIKIREEEILEEEAEERDKGEELEEDEEVEKGEESEDVKETEEVEKELPPAPNQPIYIRCAFLQLDQKNHFFSLERNISVSRGEEHLYSQRITGLLTEDNAYVKQLEAKGDIRGRFGHLASEAGKQKPTSRSPGMNTLKLSQGVKNLTCRKLIIDFSSNGKNTPQRIKAIDEAQLEIITIGNKGAPSAERRFIQAQQLEIELKPDEQVIERFTAKKRAKIEIFTFNALHPEKTMEADLIKGRFNSSTGELTTAQLIGRFRFFQANLEAYAEKAYYSEQKRYLNLRGNSKVVQEGNKVSAEKIDYSLNSEELVAHKKVVSELPPELLKEMFKLSKVEGGMVFNSDMMIYDHDKRTVHYFGRVTGLLGENILWADRALIKQKEGELTAEGSVKSVLLQQSPNESDSEQREEKMEIYSPYMEYSKEERRIGYRKGVKMIKGKIEIQAEQVDLYQSKEESGFERALANEKVEIIQEDMEAQGDNATYDFKQKMMIVSGKEARFIQKGKITHTGNILTFFLDNDKMILKAKEDGRVKTIYHPQ